MYKRQEQRWFLLSLTRFNFEGQTWLVAAHKDISKGTVAEQGLQLRNRAMAAADEGITITDATQTGNPIIYANSGFLRITGYALDQVLGRNCRFLQGPETNQQTIETIRQALRTHIPVQSNYSITMLMSVLSGISSRLLQSKMRWVRLLTM